MEIISTASSDIDSGIFLSKVMMSSLNFYVDLLPILAIGLFIFFTKKNHSNNILVGLIIMSYLFFATNFADYGTDIYFFRYIHRFIGVIAIIALLHHIFKYRINVFKDRICNFFILFFLILILSYIGNEIYLEHYIHYVRNFIFIASVSTFLYFSIDSKEKLKELFKLIMVLSILLAVIVIIYALARMVILLSVYEFDIYGYRVKLFYSNPNYLAYALLPGLVLSLFTNERYKYFFVFIFLISIVLTGSKSASISSGFILYVFLLFKVRKINIKYILVPVLISIFTLILFNERITTKVNESIRFSLIKVSINAFKSSPVNGIGYGQFRSKFYKYVDKEILELGNHEIYDNFRSNDPSFLEEHLRSEELGKGSELMTHNDVLTVFSELGLLGLIFVLLFVHRIYIELKRLILYSRENFFIVVSLIGSSIIFSFFHNNLTSLMFWFVLILPFIINRNYQKSNN
jgi:O-antigen ligase